MGEGVSERKGRGRGGRGRERARQRERERKGEEREKAYPFKKSSHLESISIIHCIPFPFHMLQYITKLMEWIEKQINNEDVFPSEVGE